MKAKVVLSLIATIVLCLPSLMGGLALLTNLLLQRHLEDWGRASTASVALGVFIGGPPPSPYCSDSRRESKRNLRTQPRPAVSPQLILLGQFQGQEKHMSNDEHRALGEIFSSCVNCRRYFHLLGSVSFMLCGPT